MLEIIPIVSWRRRRRLRSVYLWVLRAHVCARTTTAAAATQAAAVSSSPLVVVVVIVVSGAAACVRDVRVAFMWRMCGVVVTHARRDSRRSAVHGGRRFTVHGGRRFTAAVRGWWTARRRGGGGFAVEFFCNFLLFFFNF